MPHLYNTALLIGAALSAIAALLHIWVIAAGPRGYRLCGAGDRFIKAAEAGKKFPAVVTAGIALVLFIWSLYALSGAGLISAAAAAAARAVYHYLHLPAARRRRPLRPARYRPQPALYRRQLADLPRLRAGASAGDDAALGGVGVTPCSCKTAINACAAALR